MKRCQNSSSYGLCGRPATKRVKKTNGQWKNICDICLVRWTEAQLKRVQHDV